MSLEALNKQVRRDLSFLAFGGEDWVRRAHHPEGHVYDAVIIGGGQCGLGVAFGLLRERISNILVLDENVEGYEGPWVTYARMMTLRTVKQLISIDLGVPSLTFRSWWEAQFGVQSWKDIDKISRNDWMNYLRWYRKVLQLPVVNEVKVKLIEPTGDDVYRLHVEGAGASSQPLLARKVILATGIQGGGEWHVPSIISATLPRHLYAHTSEKIDFKALQGKEVAILGGGASAFDNANFALSEGVSSAHVFVRRTEIPRINPMRQMRVSGLIERFHVLSDADKYAVIDHYFKHQPPTNDTFERAASHSGFQLHLGAPWLDVQHEAGKAVITTPQCNFTFDFLIISTGLMTDHSLRPELKLFEPHIARWGDHYHAPPEIANHKLDAYPYLGPDFTFTCRDRKDSKLLHGLFVFNYSAIVSCGISASSLPGMKYGIPRLVSAVADQLFSDNREEILKNFYAYNEAEFVGLLGG
ncbi:flavin-containing monooxygenase [Paenibacillus assamensis]|uniref:flavin-containing monooxygenase n=1 Tax=Paenibacillus assamensis TaxID=311244 RepID=UPI00041C76C6|nr:NAD(P)/FAD-dependent oxidoreductase [Paenibacillus assamensis]